VMGFFLWYVLQFGLTHIVILVAVPVLLFVLVRAMLRTIGIKPSALSHGELRDAVMGLAARAGVACNNLYLLPDNKWKMVNAFASSGRNVTLSQPLVEALTRREVNAMTAHELTHLKENHI